jgi:chaperone modulatory protein CbpM
MDDTRSTALRGIVVDDELLLTTIELSRASSASESHIALWVSEGVLQPIGATREEWRFTGSSLKRMRVAMRLTRDLELNASGVALALDLLDEIEQLEARLRRSSSAGARPPRP